MDVELVEQHHPLILQVVEWPLLGFAVRRNPGTERRITCLGELYPHLTHGLAESLVEGSTRVGSHLGMIEHYSQLDGMSAHGSDCLHHN